MDLTIVPGPFRPPLDGAQERLEVGLKVLIPPNIEVVVVYDPGILSGGIGEDLVALLDDVMSEMGDATVVDC